MATNAHKLAAVLTKWSRPAISQIINSRMSSIPFVQSVQQGIINTGIVGANYNLARDIQPYMASAVDAIITPAIEGYVANIPDAAIPAMAHSIVDTAMQQGKMTLLDGAIEFDDNDILELKDLLDKNLPLTSDTSADKYEVIT